MNESLKKVGESLNVISFDRAEQYQARAKDGQDVAQLLPFLESQDFLNLEGVHEYQAMLADLRVVDGQHVLRQDARQILMSVLGERTDLPPIRNASLSETLVLSEEFRLTRGEFDLQECIGEGAFGRVFKGMYLGAPIAIKIISSGAADRHMVMEEAALQL